MSASRRKSTGRAPAVDEDELPIAALRGSAAPPAPSSATGPATDALGTHTESATPYSLPRGATESQIAAVQANPSGLLGRFGLCGLPTNTWQCSGKEFDRQEIEWRTRGVDDRNRATEAKLGGLHSFAKEYGKGSAQKHSDFKSVICQRVYTTFKLIDPDREWWLDISCGGKPVPAWCLHTAAA